MGTKDQVFKVLRTMSENNITLSRNPESSSGVPCLRERPLKTRGKWTGSVLRLDYHPVFWESGLSQDGVRDLFPYDVSLWSF